MAANDTKEILVFAKDVVLLHSLGSIKLLLIVSLPPGQSSAVRTIETFVAGIRLGRVPIIFMVMAMLFQMFITLPEGQLP